MALLVAALFGDVLVGARGFFRSDLSSYHYPLKMVVRDQTLGGSFPYWNPAIHGGQPLAANPAYELFYPPQWLVYLPGFRYFFQFHILLHLVLAAVGMVLLLRSLGAGEVAAAFGGIVFAVGGPYLSLLTRLPFLFALTWLPWILLFARRFLLAPNRRDFALAALFFGLQAILGEPVTVLQTAGIVAAFAVYRNWRDWRAAARALALTAALLLCGLLVAAVQLGPAIDHARDTVRAEGFSWQVASNWSTPFVRLSELAFPRIFQVLPGPDGTRLIRTLYPFRTGAFLSDIYLGLIPVLLAIAGFVRGVRGRLFVGIVLAISILLALGEHTPLFRLLFESGLFASIRYPEKFLLSGLFVLTVWSALVLDQLIQGDRRLRRILVVVLVLWTSAAMLFALSGSGSSNWTGPGAPLPWARYWSFNLARAAGAFVVLGIIARRRPVPAANAIIVFTLLDLSFLHLDTAQRTSLRFFDEPAVARTLPAERDRYRIFHKAAWDDFEGTARPRMREPVAPVRFGWMGMFPLRSAAFRFREALEEDVDQTELITSTRLRDAAREIKRRTGSWPPFLLSAANVEHILEFSPDGTIQVRSREVAAPRYSFAARLVQPSSDSEIVEAVISNGAVPGDVFVNFTPFQPAEGRILTVKERGGSVRIEAEAAGQTFLVASNTHHRYWRAYLDGRETDLHPANIAFHGVIIPAGRHVIELRYRNPLILPFGLVSLVATGALLFLSFLWPVAGGQWPGRFRFLRQRTGHRPPTTDHKLNTSFDLKESDAHPESR